MRAAYVLYMHQYCAVQRRCRAADLSASIDAAADCVFNALEGGPEYIPAISIVYGNAYFKSCTFRGLSSVQLPGTPGQWNLALGAFQVDGLNATLVLEDCTLTNIYNERQLVVNAGGTVYSNNPQHTVCSHSLIAVRLLFHLRRVSADSCA